MDSEFKFIEISKRELLIQSVCSTNIPFKSRSIITVELQWNSKEREPINLVATPKWGKV